MNEEFLWKRPENILDFNLIKDPLSTLPCAGSSSSMAAAPMRRRSSNCTNSRPPGATCATSTDRRKPCSEASAPLAPKAGPALATLRPGL